MRKHVTGASTGTSESIKPPPVGHGVRLATYQQAVISDLLYPTSVAQATLQLDCRQREKVAPQSYPFSNIVLRVAE